MKQAFDNMIEHSDPAISGLSPMGMPMGMPTGMPTGMSTGMPTGMSTGMPTGMPMGMPMGMPDMSMRSRLDFNNDINGIQYIDSKNRVYDTDSNINYYDLNERFNTYAKPVYPNMRTDTENPSIKHFIKSLVKKARKYWLEQYWNDLLYYIVVEGKNVRLVKSESEYDKQRENKYKDISTKEKFLKNELLTKSFLKKLIKKYVKINGVSNELENYNKYLRKYIHKQAKKKIIKAIKKDL